MSARFEGKIVAPETNTYTFYLQHDDGARLYIDNAPIIDYWGNGNRLNTTTINLAQNQEYDVKVEYYENAGGARLYLEWSYGSVSQTTVQFMPNYDQYSMIASNVPSSITVLPPI